MIPSKVTFTVDVRSVDGPATAKAMARLHEDLAVIAQRSGTGVDIFPSSESAPVPTRSTPSSSPTWSSMPETPGRGFVGYGPRPPDPAWPGGASIAVQFAALLVVEDEERQPKMLAVVLHARLFRRPGRLAALERFIDHVRAQDRVWVCQRVEIARHWTQRFPPPGAQEKGAP